MKAKVWTLKTFLCALLAVMLLAGGASASTTLFYDDFESAFRGWSVSGKASWYSGSPKIGTHAVKVPKNASIQRTVSSVGWQDVAVSFSVGANLSKSGATFQALWFDGASWNVLKEFRKGDSDADASLHYFEFDLPEEASNNARLAVRFRLNSKSPSDAGYVDNVMVTVEGRFTCTLSLSGNDGMVKVDGVSQALPWSGDFEYGASVVLQAVPDEGYHFTGWSGALTGSTNPVVVLMDRSKDVAAAFAVDTYQLAINSGTGHGSVTVDGVPHTLPWVGVFDRGASVLLQAVPDPGYRFAGWAGGVTGSTNPTFISMDGDRSVSAGFASDSYVLSLSGNGSGGVKVDGVYHPVPDTVTVSYGSTVTLEAVPDTGWGFIQWAGDLSGSANPTSLPIDSDKTVTADFALNQYEVNLSGTGSGSVVVDGASHSLPWSGVFDYGSIIVLQAAPGTGSHFVSWSGDLTGAATPTMLLVDGSKAILATFALNTYTLTVDGANGTVEVNGAPRALPWSGPFAAGEVADLRAVPVEGYGFSGWSGDLSGSTNPTSITMNGDRSVTAAFAPFVFTLTVQGLHGSLNVDDAPQTLPYSASYDYGTVVLLEAVPDASYRFTQWSGDLSGTTNPVEVTMMSDMTITAGFSAGLYTLGLSGTGGSVKVNDVAHALPWAGEYDYGVNVTLEAVPEACTRFSEWSGDLLGWDNPATVVMDGDKNVVAGFASIEVFSDIPCDFWAAREIAACVDAGIVKGFDDGTYRPAIAVGRDQMAVYIARAVAGGDSQVPAGPPTATFSDVPTDFWAFRYIEYARSESIVTGYPNGTYEPTVPLDRGQMAVFIARAMADPSDRPGLDSYQPPSSPSFADVPADFWSLRFVEYIADPDHLVTRGYPDGLYHPEQTCARDQMAAYIARAFQLPL
jgi:hypothetical protein